MTYGPLVIARGANKDGTKEGRNTFTHILVPTDGSQLSDAAIQQGTQFAKGINAKVTGFHVTPQFHVFTYRTEISRRDRKGGQGGDHRSCRKERLRPHHDGLARQAGRAGVLIGNETQKVLTHSKILVLVYR